MQLIDIIETLARENCHTSRVDPYHRYHFGKIAGSLVTDSGGSASKAEALRTLDAANPRRFHIIEQCGSIVVGYWPENIPNAK